MLTFGPVPSRRLGRSLGVNNIPPKVCTFACIYCQLGRTTRMSAERRAFYRVEDLLRDVQDKVEQAEAAGEQIDYLTFVPDGEPTLDIALAEEIVRLKPLGIKIAVITNSSLLALPDVRDALAQADWVSLKADAVDEKTWRSIDRPHGALQLDAIQEGMLTLAATYKGELVTETMLVRDVNDGPEQVESLAGFLGRLRPAKAYLAVPTRPPAESWVRPPTETALNRSYHLLRDKVDQVEYLIGYEGNAFSSTGDPAEDLLSITAVHPMRRDAIYELLALHGKDWSLVQSLIDRAQLSESMFEGQTYYLRTMRRSS